MNRPLWYTLDKQTPIPCNNAVAWSNWFETADRHVGEDEVAPGCLVSTVFLGLDHSFAHADEPPVLFETMIFGGEHDDLQRRYATWTEAAVGHQEVVAVLRSWYATLRQEAVETMKVSLEESGDREF